MKQLIIAPDSFKGSLSAREVAEAFEAGFAPLFPECVIRKIPIADGGEGSVEILIEYLGGRYEEIETFDPLGRPIRARYGVWEDRSTALIELSAASGLTLLAPKDRNPMKTSTYGTGLLIRHALSQGLRRILLFLGGSATNDGATGLLQALGIRFWDTTGESLEGNGENLPRIARITCDELLPEVTHCEIILACDVTNPFYGPQGASAIFAPQKGANPEMVEKLDRGLQHLASVIQQYNGFSLEDLPGSGAAGGVAGGIAALLGGEIKRGIEILLHLTDFDRQIAHSDLIVTGEGRLDSQTRMGKSPWGVLQAARRHGIPTLAIAGSVAPEAEQLGFWKVCSIHPHPVPLELAMAHDYAFCAVRKTADTFARWLKEHGPILPK